MENEELVESLNETETNTVEVKQIEIINDNFISKNEVKTINNYLQNLQKITSKTLQKEIIKYLENLQLNLELEKDREIFSHLKS